MGFWNRLFGKEDESIWAKEPAQQTVAKKNIAASEDIRLPSDQLNACPTCGNTQSPFVTIVDLKIFRCSCGKTYCDKCSGGGLIDLPRCPVSSSHENMKQVGVIRSQQKAQTTPMKEARDLYYAACDGDEPKVTKLLAEGVSPNYRDVEGYTPLHVAAKRGSVEIVRQLIAAGTDENAKSKDGYSPLCWVAGRFTSRYGQDDEGTVEVVKQLIAAGADVNAKSNAGYSPLYQAANRGLFAVVELLLLAGANANIKSGREEFGQTPLHAAATMSNDDIVRLLLNHGADVNATDNSGLTPIGAVNHRSSLTAKGRAEITQLLAEHGGRG